MGSSSRIPRHLRVKDIDSTIQLEILSFDGASAASVVLRPLILLLRSSRQITQSLASCLSTTNTCQASSAGIVEPTQTEIIHPEALDLTLDVGIKAQSTELIELVVEADGSQTAIIKVRARRDGEVLSHYHFLGLCNIIPLIACSNKVTGSAGGCGIVVTSNPS